MQNVKCKMQNWFIRLCIVHCALCIGACSIPNLELQSCIDSRTAVREFYSFHFGNDMTPSTENLKMREQYLTPRLFSSLSAATKVTGDYFTTTSDFPKAFRVGECKESSPDRTVFQVLLFWKDDVRTEQRPISVETVKVGDKWLIDAVVRLER